MDKSDVAFMVKIAAFVSTIGVTVFLATGYLVNLGDESACRQYQQVTGRETKFVGGFFTKKCYVNVDGKWFSIDQVRTEN